MPAIIGVNRAKQKLAANELVRAYTVVAIVSRRHGKIVPSGRRAARSSTWR